MTSSSKYKFMQQQGFEVGGEESTKKHFQSLLFQPTIVGTLLIISVIFQFAGVFLMLGVILWFNAIVPAANPFERVYDVLIGRRKGYQELPPAPMPRRFMQGMAGSLMLLAGYFILKEWTAAAYTTQALIVVAFSLLLFGKFCVGAYLYHLLKGNKDFANKTCPWSK